MVSRGIGMELPGLRAVRACGNVDPTKYKIAAMVSVTTPPRGGVGDRAERCVIVAGYLRTKFF